MTNRDRKRWQLAAAAVSVLLVGLLAPRPASPYSMGAPESACDDGVPKHGPAPRAQPAPYRVSVSAEDVESSDGRHILVRLSAADADPPFIGFLLQARNSTSGALSGKFVKEKSGDEHTLLDCNEISDAVTHSNKREKREVAVRWEAPPGSSGHVMFRATFVRNKETFWVGVESQKVLVKRSATPAPAVTTRAPVETTDATPPLKEGGRNPNLSFPPGVDKARTGQPQSEKDTKRQPASTFDGLTGANGEKIYEGCGSTKGCFGNPEMCIEKKNCQQIVTYAAASDDKSSYRFELQGLLDSDDGYVAVGFSHDAKMGEDAVAACMSVEGRDVKMEWAYNIPGPRKGNSISKDQQTGLIVRGHSLNAGILYCQFELPSEFVGGSGDTTTNFTVNKENYYLLLATGPNNNPNELGYHTEKVVTNGATNLSATFIGVADDMLFVRLHGAFMFGAWIGSASLGMLFARYYKTTWTKTQCFKKDMWFRLHQTFMITTWGLTMAGFVLIFLEIGDWSYTKDNPHPILGCVTTGLCFLQPIGALFRPAPDAKRRPIFNWLHWFGGNAAQIVGIVAMFFALKLDKAKLPDEVARWILVAFVAFHGLVHFILSIAQCVSDNRHRDSRADVYPMKDMGVGQSYYYPQTKQDAPGGGLRKFMLGLYIIVNVAFTAVLVLMVIFAPIQETLEKWHLNIF